MPAAEATKDLTEARAAIALQLKQDKGLRKLIESKTVKLDDILDDDGNPDLQKLNRLRDMIREKAPLSQLKSEARKNGMLYMQEEGLRLVVKGLTSIEELMRVVK